MESGCQQGKIDSLQELCARVFFSSALCCQDADLVDLSPGKMEAQKLAHDRFEKSLQENPLKGTRESFSVAGVARVKDENLRKYIKTLIIPSSNQHFKRQHEL